MDINAEYLLDQITDILQKHEIDNEALALDLAIFTLEHGKKVIKSL